MDQSFTLNHKRVRHRILHDDIRPVEISIVLFDQRALISAPTGATIISRINFMSYSSSRAGGKPRHRLQKKLRSAVLFNSSGYGSPPARPTVLETDASALPIQSFLPMSRIRRGDQPQLLLMRPS
jgi:hypothetical protein